MVMDLDGRMALKRILQKKGVREWARFIRTGSSERLHCSETSCYSKGRGNS
jgi:hypothetical protein